MRRARLTTLMLSAVLAIVLGTAAAAPAQTPPPPEEADGRTALEAAVRAYSAAFLANDVATAYAALSENCQDELSRAEFRKVLRPVARKYGDAEIEAFKIVKYSDERARVTYRYDESAIDVKKEPWVNEDGAWRRNC